MDRRHFLQRIAVTTAVGQALSAEAAEAVPAVEEAAADVDVAGQTLLCEFKLNSASWKVYEDLSKRDGSISFVPDRGNARVLGKRPEATFTQATVPHMGYKMEEIGASLPDLLAIKLLEHGDPDHINLIY
jgi:hypothetical protein